MTDANSNNDKLSFVESGRYKILSVLGEGGMGKVYLAQDLKLNRRVAIKTLRTKLDDSDGKLAARTRREGKILSRLRHSSLVPVYEMDMTASVPYIVQGYVEGKSLGQKIERGKFLTFKEGWKLFKEQAEVLSYIHQEGLLHRDIKPDNIMIDGSGTSVLMDFGLALNVEDTRLTAEDQFVGTIQYCSPEILLSGEDATPSNDVYQLGMVVYEAITGKIFIGNAKTMEELVALLAKADWDKRPLPSDVPQSLGRIIAACCKYDIKERLANGSKLLEAINSEGASLKSGSSKPSGKSSKSTGKSGRWDSVKSSKLGVGGKQLRAPSKSRKKTKETGATRKTSKRLIYICSMLFAVLAFSLILYFGFFSTGKKIKTIVPRC